MSKNIIPRNALSYLKDWLIKDSRKPLLIRGARQTGKTTLVTLFSQEFKQFLFFNLENPKHRRLFETQLPFQEMVQALFFEKNGNPHEPSTLIFIDEIQNSPRAVSLLRFFAEEAPQIPVIAAGSLPEVYLEKRNIGFPVGRVEFLYLQPVTFSEFLRASEDRAAEERASDDRATPKGGVEGAGFVKTFETVPLPSFAVGKLFGLFHRYTMVGGMPAVCADYIENLDLSRLSSLYESLLVSFTDDAGKYTENSTMYQVVRHAIESAPLEAGTRITFQGFGKSNYRSREMGEALRTLQRAMILYLVYPITSFGPPVLPDKKKSPKLQFLDTGLINYSAGITSEFLKRDDLTTLYRGRIAEHIVAQEMLARNPLSLKLPHFWVREKRGSSAEVDFVVQYKDLLVPIELKAGKSGRLRSLHVFMDNVDHDCAIRLYNGPLSVDEVSSAEGKPYRLLNLPYFLAGLIDRYIEWMFEE